MANRYANLVGSKKISEDFNNINIGFDKVQGEMDINKVTADTHIANADIHVTAAKKLEWDAKAPGNTLTDLNSHKANTVVHVTQADHDKLNDIEAGAQVNQNAFSTVNDIAATDSSDAVTIKGGVGITVTSNPTSKEVTVTATGEAAPGAHGTTHTEHGADPIPTATLTEGGIMSAEQVGELTAHGELLDEHATAITVLEDRLDTAAADPVTLQPGLQVINSAKDSLFKLGEIKGKTEINGQGRVGIIGVENPYVINTSSNLLPPLYEWGVPEGSPKIKNPYSVEVSNVNKIEIALPVIGGQTYNLSVKSSAVSGRLFVRYNTETVIDITGSAGELKGTFIAPQGAKEVAVRLLGTSTDSVIMSDIMVYVGIEVKPFKPQRKSMLAFQAELHANPTDGSDPDVLFEHGGQYNKLAKWKKVVLDGSLKYGYFGNVGNAKVVYVDSLPGAIPSTPQGVLTKYNGAQLINNLEGVAGWPGADVWQMGASGYNVLYLSISNADSGWGLDYTPTPDEITAYFMGWKMYEYGTQASATTVYNRTDGLGKGWTAVNGNYSVGYQTIPATYAPDYSPYNLLFRLAKESVEPVVPEGCLTLTEGDNVVEVGTGIVLRERAKPDPMTTDPNYVVNVKYQATTNNFLTNKAAQILSIYRNRQRDGAWNIFINASWAEVNGKAYASIPKSNFDVSAAYSVTYIKLDKSPIQPITGAVAANEKAQLSDLTAGVAEALHGVSVLTQKKADKEAPDWITPTLLNGATQFGDVTFGLVGYRKVGNYIEFSGLIVPTVALGVVFILPPEYRPAYSYIVACRAATSGVADVRVHKGGEVTIGNVDTWVSLWNIRVPLN